MFEEAIGCQLSTHAVFGARKELGRNKEGTRKEQGRRKEGGRKEKREEGGRRKEEGGRGTYKNSLAFLEKNCSRSN